jgi:hypothetical protein
MYYARESADSSGDFDNQLIHPELYISARKLTDLSYSFDTQQEN